MPVNPSARNHDGVCTVLRHRALDEVRRAGRECVVHAFVEGATHEQIAERIAAPAGAVKSCICRSLVWLKPCLS